MIGKQYIRPSVRLILEAMIMNKEDKIVDRKIGNIVVQRHHELDFTPEGMICLIRRLEEYNPSEYDHSHISEDITTDYKWDNSIAEEDREGKPYDFWQAAYNLRASILETLGVI